MKKIRVAIIFGGRSAEHEVSLISAKNVLGALNRERYEPILVGISKDGRWHLHNEANYLLNETNAELIALNDAVGELVVVPGQGKTPLRVHAEEVPTIGPIDVAFPILHGTYGEDGTVQGLLKLLDVPFVGAGILGSAVGMDKDVMKRLLRDAGIPIGKFLVLHRSDIAVRSFAEICSFLGETVFVKPANAGSSVGVSKVQNEAEFKRAVSHAFEFDRKILVEEFIAGREIECSVLGNDEPIVSVPGEIIPSHEFYSYEAKYIDKNGARAEIPARLPPDVVTVVQRLAIQTYQALCCEGMGRVDCFVTHTNEVFVNEINTIPGFTSISMYPKLWEASGVSYSHLIERLIELAISRHTDEASCKTSR